MSPYSMMLFANQAIQAGQQNLLSVASKKLDKTQYEQELTNNPPNNHKHNQAQGAGVARTGQGPDLDGWCPAWATHRNQKANVKSKVETMNYYHYDLDPAAKYYNPTSLEAVKADLLKTPVMVPQRQATLVAAASAPSFFPMGPEEEVFDIELEELTNQVKKTVLLTPKHRTPGPQRPNSEKIPKAPARRNSRCIQSMRKRSFQCEEVMEYAVDTYIWKLHLQSKYHVKGRIDYRTCGITGEMRQTLLQWLANVARHLTFSLETWCLAVNYLDRFLSVQAVDKECLQLVGLTTLLIAAKIEEQNPPEILELVELCSSAYTRKNFKHMEVIILSRLEYNLLAPTASFLLSHKVQVMGAKADWPNDLSRHMVEMILSDPEFGFHIPADISSAIYTVIKRSEPMMLREITIHCPICAPVYGDIYAREFVVCCYNEITDYLLKLKESEV